MNEFGVLLFLASGVLQCVSALLDKVLMQLLLCVCGRLLLKESIWRVLVVFLKTEVVNSPLSRRRT